MISKNELQADIVELFLKQKQGYFIGAGGLGKTTTAIKCIKALPDNLLVHIIVPRISLKLQWEEELVKWEVKNAIVYVINTYTMSTSMISDFLIIDECHLAINELAKVFNKCLHASTFTYFLGLTATLNEEHATTFHTKNIFCIKEVTFKEALLNKWVSPVQEYNRFLDFTPEEQKLYDKANESCEKYFNFFHRNFNDVMNALSNPDFRKEYARKRNLEEAIIGRNAVNFNRFLKARKDLIFNAENKVIQTVDICNHYNEKTIIFSESTKFVDIVHSKLANSLPYHSNLNDKDKKNNLELFLKDRIQILVACKAADQGVNKPSASLGIIASGTSNPNTQMQRIFRFSRYVESKQSRVFNLVMKNSQELSWLKARQKNSDRPIII